MIINITQVNSHVWRAECSCGFFALRGNKRRNGYTPAKIAAKDHNKNFHHNKYKISTEGSEIF